ncbi:hypothetical protein BDV93DRAFT_518361 [Ceratobasidium sp. AG-I]|nr:hypothetical protein BDV93DRAFT_518361 [Ceratobasidium sp. AG-I]
MRDRIGDRIEHHRHPDESHRPRAHSVLPPPARRQSYDPRPPDPHRDRRQSTSVIPADSWGSPPSQQPAPYYTQDAFGAHAYIEPRAPSHPHQMPPPPPHPHWGYQLPPPQPYPSSSRGPPRSPGPYPDPRAQQYRPPAPGYYAGAPGYGPPGPPYGPGPGGATVDPNIFKPDPYARHPGMPSDAGPPDAGRPDVQITYTDDSATKLTQYLRRRCFNCRVTEPPGWRKSTLNPGKIVCNKCGLYERSHARPRPLHMDNPKGPAQ